jgi:tetratricopeptide (TPR) repeat protein
MMVKNEEDVVRETLELALPYVDEVVLLDTGSTDATLRHVKQVRCDHPAKPIHVYEAPFSDFATTRNQLLDYARTVSTAPFFLALDASDRLERGYELRRWLEQHAEQRHITSSLHTVPDMYLVQLECNQVNSVATRVFSNHALLHYRWPVHEYLCHRETGKYCVHAIIPNVCIVHDRTRDAHKTRQRLPHDKQQLRALLSSVVDDRPMQMRVWYYLAQTCIDLGEYDQAIFWLEARIQEQGKNNEEFYLSVVRWAYLKLQQMQQVVETPVITTDAQSTPSLGAQGANSEECESTRTVQCVVPEGIGKYDAVLRHLTQAYGMYPQRAEALYYMAYIYGYISEPRNLAFAYLLAQEACRKQAPYGCANAVQTEVYEFLRWDMLGHLAFMMGQYKEATTATMAALTYKHLRTDKAAELQEMLALYRQKGASGTATTTATSARA